MHSVQYHQLKRLYKLRKIPHAAGSQTAPSSLQTYRVHYEESSTEAYDKGSQTINVTSSRSGLHIPVHIVEVRDGLGLLTDRGVPAATRQSAPLFVCHAPISCHLVRNKCTHTFVTHVK